MQAISSRVVKLLLTSLVLLGMLGCGTSTNNDQGIVFTHLGYYQEGSSSCGEIPTGMSGAIVPLSNPFEGFGSLYEFLAFIGLSNSLEGQTIRTQRVFMEYEIPGASKQPPSASVPLSALLGPSASGEGGETEGDAGASSAVDSSLPGAFTGICNSTYAQVSIVTPQVMEWINLNRSALPEAPFMMIVTTYVTGLSSAGDRYDTNREQIVLDMTPDNIISPTDGTAPGTNGSEEFSGEGETAVAE